jgi:nucleoside-diphosphate-sugar epimerase
MSNVLVTGAAGFVGSRLCQAFTAAGFEVTGLDRVAPRSSACQHFWARDLLDATEDVCGFSTVVHLAGLLPGKAPVGDLFAVNVGGTSAVLRRYVSQGTHLILFSTGLVYGDRPGPFDEATPCRPLDPYAESKLAAEAVARAGCESRQAVLTVVRPSIIYGTGAPAGMLLVSMMGALRRGETFPMTAGEQRRDFLHVDDVASAVVGLAQRRIAGVFNLAAGESHTVREVAGMAADLSGRGELLRLGQLPYRRNEVFDYRLDPRAIRKALGWQPGVSLRDGLARLWKESS